ncbi:hypothetical protein [Kineococcus auxinigenes]|uniref:hypothetical protein n=1 Tax=unclassified Kineococcus TaxID=2621656 RepID=UPI003D7E3FD3
MRRPVAAAGAAAALLVALTGCSLGTADAVPGAVRVPTGPAVTPLPIPELEPSGTTAAVTDPFRRAADGTALPVLERTPGAVFADVTQADLCGPRYSAGVRDERSGDAEEAAAGYGIEDSSPYTTDHLVPISLGGSNEVSNLWPQPKEGAFAAAAKNTLEAHLRALVCQGTVPLETARQALVQDWRAAYDTYTAMPLATPSATAAPSQAASGVVSGGVCATDGEVTRSPEKQVRLTCRADAEGVLRWQRRA